jgi:hypothetical protein
LDPPHALIVSPEPSDPVGDELLSIVPELELEVDASLLISQGLSKLGTALLEREVSWLGTSWDVARLGTAW